jgi:hypothetical protein
MATRNVLTRERLQRLRVGRTLFDLSVESGLSMATLSMAERGLQKLSRDQEQERRAAIERLSTDRQAVAS